MYRKRARAAHVLQQPSVAAAAPAAANANGPPVDAAANAGYGGGPPNNYNPANGVQPHQQPGVQFFNPLSYQNGFVNEPNIAAVSQENFPPASNQAQYSGNSNQIQGSDTQFGAEQFGGHPQDVYGGQYGHQGGQQLQDQSAQQQVWDPVKNDWSRQPSQESQVGNQVTTREPSSESHYSHQSQQPTEEQAWQHQQQQQAYNQQQQDYQQQHQTEQVQQSHGEQVQQQHEGMQQQYELILDPSGQWCWDYMAQQWIPYQQQQQHQPLADQKVEDAAHAVQEQDQVTNEHQQQVNWNNTNGHKDENIGNVPEISSQVYNHEAVDREAIDQSIERQEVEQHHHVESGGVEMIEAAKELPQLPAQEQNPSFDANEQGVINGLENLSLMGDTQPRAAEQQQQSPQLEANPQQPPLQPDLQNAFDRQSSIESNNYPNQDEVGEDGAEICDMSGQAMGPPDLVDDVRQSSRPELVNDTDHHAGVEANIAPPPDMFAYPISSYTYSGSPASLPPQPDIEHVSSHQPYEANISSFGGAGHLDLGQSHDQPISSAAPDLTAQSVIQSQSNHVEPLHAATSNPHVDPFHGQAAGHSVRPSQGGAAAHDQHYDFYKDQIENAMPDLTSGQQRSSRDSNSSRSNLPPRRPSQDKAPDILRTEPLVPSTDRNLYMETGELQEEDAQRVSQELPPSIMNISSSPFLASAQSSAPTSKPPSDLPPMVGGNEPPMVGGNQPPGIVRMVVGESVSSAPPLVPAPVMMPIPPPTQRMVEGESNTGSTLPALPRREIEGEAVSSARPTLFPNTIDRTIEGEDENTAIAPPPVQTREVEGQPQPPTARQPPPPMGVGRPSQPPIGVVRSPQVPIGNARQAAATGRNYPIGQMPTGAINVDQDSALSTPLDSSPSHQSTTPAPIAGPSPPTTEVRSAAAGSEKRDETVMGGPPAPIKAPPLPTPGRDVAGQESSAPTPRRRGDDHKKCTYDSDDDNIPESDIERNNVQKRRIQPRRNLSPKGNRSARPIRGYDRNRSSTDRDDDSDRRYDHRRDDDDYRSYKNYDRKHHTRREYERRHHYDDDDDRRSMHARDNEDRRSMYGREDDRRSYHGGRRTKDSRREDTFYRRGRMDSEYDGDSYYGEEHPNNRTSRPGSRTGSVSHFDLNESVFSRVGGAAGLQGGMASLQYQLIQQQQQYQYQQYQIQVAVKEMEKVLTNKELVNKYKAYWDTYGKQPNRMDKLRLEDPVLHYVLHHFKQNYWHLVTDTKPASVKEDTEDANVDPVIDSTDREVEEFARKFHQLSPSHRPESRQAGQESTIAGPQDSIVDQSSAHILPDRLTPLMFSRPHVCARISGSGLLVKVDAHSPRDGQSATVEIHSVAALMQHTQDYRQLTLFPGPLKPKETHKNDVIKFCERKIYDVSTARRMVDKESYELIWRMLILLLRQKGQVEGSDLADLLIAKKNRSETSAEVERSRGGSFRGQVDAEETASLSSFSEDHIDKSERTTSSKTCINSALSQEEQISKFRAYLLHGNKQEGLEYAMKEGLWGHALFLASKMDQRTYASVMHRFSNGLAVNDPLQTLYQLMSARIPAAMKNFADQRLGDWRPHLAMILSNPYPGSDINRRSIVTLGDTLLSKGQIYAAQFCYIVSALEFGTFSKKTSKLVLLLSMPGEKSVDEFATNEAIQCTEIYEFVQKLGNPDFEMPTLQPFKFLHAVRLVEAGLSSQAQDYCKQIAEFVVANPTKIVTDFLPDFLTQLEHLSDKLKYQDPQYTTSSGELSEIPDPEWLVKLREAVHNIHYSSAAMYSNSEAGDTDIMSYNEPQSGYYDSGLYQQHTSHHHQQNYEQNQEGLPQIEQQANVENYSTSVEDQVQTLQPDQPAEQQHLDYNSQANENIHNGWGHMQSIPEQIEQPYMQQSTDQQPAMFNPSDYVGHTSNNDYQEPSLEPAYVQDTSAATPAPMYDPTSIQPNSYEASQADGGISSVPTFDPSNIAVPTFDPTSVPTFDATTMGAGSRKTSMSDHGSRRNSLVTPPSNIPDNHPPTSQPNNSKLPANTNDKKPAKQDSSRPERKSWFGGIFGKILKAPNQIHLPDDTKKTIYYDEDLKRWVNTDEDEDTSTPAAPPPMDPAFMMNNPPMGQTAQLPGAPSNAPPTAPTSFRRKGRGRAYVDVIGQSGITKPISSTNAPPMLMPSTPSTDQPPGGMTPMLFNPAAVSQGADDGPSSLQLGGSIGAADGQDDQNSSGAQSMPMMFNPSSMGSVTAPPTF